MEETKQHLGISPETAEIRILLFSGTTEGRQLAESLKELSVYVYVSTATEYGRECTGTGDNIETATGRMDETAICHFLDVHKIDLAVDATHPFARMVTENIQNACKANRTEYIRCLREKQNIEALETDHVIFKKSVSDAVEYLKGKEGKILIATGSKELKLYTEIDDYQERCIARVLSTREAVEESTALGFKGRNLIAMQGPFSKELNIAMLRYTGARYFVTKESGKAGGFQEKAEAAKETGARLVVITRPEESGTSPAETLLYIRQKIRKKGTSC